MNRGKDIFIVEELTDLRIDNQQCPISAKVYELFPKYFDSNIILESGEMICFCCPDKIKGQIFDFFQKILMEFIESEKKINECNNIKNKYIKHEDNSNNSNIYFKKISDIIINMDRANKYIHSISSLLVDGIKEYKKYIEWQENTIKIQENIRKEWELIYKIRCKLEHPEELKTTFFERRGETILVPKIIYKNVEYDLLELGEKSIQYVYIFLRLLLKKHFFIVNMLKHLLIKIETNYIF